MMWKRSSKILVWLVLVGSLTIQADPIVNWMFSQTRFYENGQPQDADDIWEWTLHCNDTPGDQGPPYEMDFALLAGPDSINDIDMAPIVAVGGLGQYWCSATTYSQKYLESSSFTANEKDFLVTAQSTGYVPLPPTW